ncbi:MAG: hypothetical protein B6D61_01185 [Bacteroidetes bacterium 4484_249]|nr:MAG: hypothetical protein B6D61_01185 [Bacteroidetes bacterium 4484_249]
MKKEKIIVIILIFLLVNTSCERHEPSDLNTFDCSTCYQDRPEMGRLTVALSINSENPFVPLVIYRGNFENNDIEYIDTSWSEDYWVEVPVDKYYSVTAKYKDGNKTVIAVDGDKLELEYTSEDCDLPCYYYKGGYIDVRLRN